jgi:hypothetical protein
MDPLCEGGRFLEREAKRSLEQEIGRILDGLVCFVFQDLSSHTLRLGPPPLLSSPSAP